MSRRGDARVAHPRLSRDVLTRLGSAQWLMAAVVVLVLAGTSWTRLGLGSIQARRNVVRSWVRSGGISALQFPLGDCGLGELAGEGLTDPAGIRAGGESGLYWEILGGLASTGEYPYAGGQDQDRCAEIDSTLAYALGSALFGSGREDLALECWEHSGAAARFLQIGIMCQEIDASQARSYYDLTLQTAGPGDSRVLESLIWLYAGMDAPAELEEALAKFQQSGDQSSSMFFLTVGRAQLALAADQDAIESLQRAAELEPESWMSLYWAAMAYSQTGEYELAQQMYERALVAEPGEGIVMVRIGDLLRSQGDWDGAYAWYDRASTIASSEAKAVASMCRVRLDQKRFSDAMELADRLLLLDPRAYAWELASRAAEGIGEIELARDHMKRALELDPANERYLERWRELGTYQEGESGPVLKDVDGGARMRSRDVVEMLPSYEALL